MRIFCSKKTFIPLLSATLFALMFVTSCSSDDKESVTLSFLRVSTDKSLVDFKENTILLDIESDNDETWRIVISEDDKNWISADKESGIRNSSVKLTLSENKEAKDRFAKVSISTSTEEKAIYITQTGSPDPAPDISNANWIELPAKSSIQNAILVGHLMLNAPKVRNYSMLYDTINKLAYWVAYPMHSYYIGSSGRTDDWQNDPYIDAVFQPQLFGGFGIAQIDRGHQIPSADRTVNREANATTFYFSNMTAQNSDLNQGIWADLEAKVRIWTKQCDTLYVVTGAMIKTATNISIDYVKDNSGASVAKPKYYYKALAKRMGDTYYTIAYKMDNQAPPAKSSYANYQITVAQLEQETGFSFFPKVSSEVKSKIIADQWK